MLNSPDLSQHIEVTVIGGHGRWAYWQDRAERKVIADIVCQPMASHFAGQLGTEWHSIKPGPAHLHVSGYIPERPNSVFDAEEAE